MKDEVLALLAAQSRCVISTVGQNGLPEAAMVGFSNDQDLSLVIGTSNKSRKYKNLQTNPNVAIVIGFGTDASVQYEGAAKLLEGDELGPRLEAHFKKVPMSAEFAKNDDQAWILVTPTWVRYMVHGPNARVEEMSEF